MLPLVFFRYSIPNRRQVVPFFETNDEITGTLKSDIEQTESISTTHNGWTSLNTESYTTLTAYFTNVVE